ncbi:MAG: saccharopine dehydrogenase NADP-binding domain-containing protein [Candidatus Cloacimonetes bacterium]|jgi:lysine 6-dehydrogenase|nr:saccharopine dehydrogenase NADP-binding domain-containing protein [Candidatus Cloacimonadota bacterium]
MNNLVVLGAGMVGRAIAIDLAKKHNVISADICEKSLSKLEKFDNIETIKSDLSNKESFKKLIKDSDLVVSAVPGFMGFATLKTIIESKKDVVDIAFFPEDALQLDDLAKKHNVTAIMDCGVAPGMSNAILGYHNSKMTVEDFEFYVGGLPQKRTLPFQYKAPFSPIDVIEEYIRSARFVVNGEVVVKPALSDTELIEFEDVGTLEAFNTDGLRSLIKTMDIPNMKEKTLRYPGYIDQIKLLKDYGFFQTEEVEIDGNQIRPIDLTSHLLISKWKLEDDEPEFTVMKIVVSGIEKNKQVKYIYELFDKFDVETQTSSMARTTGYSCTSAVELVLNGDYAEKGLFPPEFLGAKNDCLKKMLAYQEDRDIIYKISKT